jgi:hypothetical protein
MLTDDWVAYKPLRREFAHAMRQQSCGAFAEPAKRRERADAAPRKATEDLQTYCLEAQKAKVPITRIAEEAGLSRQGVYDLLAERP